MLRYVVLRLLAIVPVLLGVTLLVFTMVWVAPGDPVLALLGESSQGISGAALDDLRRAYGLDRPIALQYFSYLGDVLQGDFGISVRSRLPVLQEVLGRFPATLLLTSVGMGLAILVGVSLGVLAAVFRRTWVDYFAVLVALAGVSVPVFWSGLILMTVFAMNLNWLPASGYGSWQNLILPAVTIGFASSAFIARITRSSLLEVLNQDYVRTARAKGLPPISITLKHAFRNAILPVITVIGLQFGGLLGGAVLTETVFAWPGVGRMLVDAIRTRDLPLIQGTILFVSLIFILVNLLVDISYAFLNPRIRYD